ncbi:hypothetical protein BAY59_33690 [Prauserella coralliicola]|uniref:Uncharacterized protein n=1 Tax=Prauserella flavalba TaxID=1477506 RepID=A0A318L9H4_9PSEU|nr:hypothetical protein BA062_36835 [Prauserella flavalba]PXY18630.1 hypothetical protein BAY59_33690 [Prauserella coralliicola]
MPGGHAVESTGEIEQRRLNRTIGYTTEPGTSRQRCVAAERLHRSMDISELLAHQRGPRAAIAWMRTVRLYVRLERKQQAIRLCPTADAVFCLHFDNRCFLSEDVRHTRQSHEMHPHIADYRFGKI